MSNVNKEESIFDEAIKIESASKRAAYLKSACKGDEEFLARVEALLKVHYEDKSFLDASVLSTDVTFDDSPLTEGPGTKIDRYKLLQQIGEGGFGVVYMAEQERPIRRRVALKIIKLGMDTKQVIARFEAERQALALMDHPNIAKVLDAGATDTGRPYFVMELVKGIPITEYCDKNNLDTRQRLELFIDVCKAVQHAHQKGIIHRDIKPTNVMITLHDGIPVPKVIDFGIAKATQQRLTEKTLFTEFKQFIGTPEYMSPEQAEMSGLDVDTRTDIYSLGVLLYELLTGTTPFGDRELRSAGFDEIRRIIREDEPPRPSTCLSTLGDSLDEVAKHRKSGPGQLRKIIRGELDWIVMMTLEKDRTRRYETANELARDIQRHLGDEPVVAGPPSAVYRMSKFVRRNRALVTGIAAVLIVLAVGIVVSAIFAVRESKAKSLAEQATKKETIARSVAEEARGIAEQAEKSAKKNSEELRRTLYVNRIQLANSKYDDGNISLVQELLEECPEDLRGWEWYRLNHIADQSIMTLRGHDEIVYSVALSPDGKRIVSGSRDKAVKVWDAQMGAEVMTLYGHESYVKSVAFSPDGKRIVSGSRDKAVKVWDAQTGAEVMTLYGHESGLRSVAFSPDGKRIVSGSNDQTIKVWDAATGRELMTLRGQDWIYSVTFSPDSKRIVSGGADKTIKLWDAETGAELMTIPGHDEGVNSIAFSSDGKRIVSSGDDASIKVWDASTGNELLTLQDHHWVNHAAFSPDGKRIVSGGYDSIIKIWDAETGDKLMTLRGHEAEISSVVFSPDGKRIISGSFDKTIKVWDASISHEVMTLSGHKTWVQSIAFSPNGKRIVSGSADATIKMWDAATGAEVMTLSGHEKNVGSVAFSPDGKRIVSGSSDKTIKIWDVETGANLKTFRGHENNVFCVEYSPDGKRIVSSSWDRTIKVWDAATGIEQMTLRKQEGGYGPVAFSPDGQCIASANGGGEIKVWDVITGAELMTLRGHDNWIHSVAFSPDGKRIVSGSYDTMVKVWDVATGAEVITLHGHRDAVLSVTFSPDGKRIISGSQDQTVKVWDAITGTELITIWGHVGYVSDVRFSPDGKALVSSSGDGTIKIWESATPVNGYETRKTAEAAREIVGELYTKQGLYQKVIDVLKADETLDEAVRKVALQIANSRLWEDAEKLKEENQESTSPEEVTGSESKGR
jgi:WD40 repeat protein/serine/threonine protein kinase